MMRDEVDGEANCNLMADVVPVPCVSSRTNQNSRLCPDTPSSLQADCRYELHSRPETSTGFCGSARHHNSEELKGDDESTSPVSYVDVSASTSTGHSHTVSSGPCAMINGDLNKNHQSSNVVSSMNRDITQLESDICGFHDSRHSMNKCQNEASTASAMSIPLDYACYPHCPIYIPSKGRFDYERGTITLLVRELIPFTVIVEAQDAEGYIKFIDQLVVRFYGISGMSHGISPNDKNEDEKDHNDDDDDDDTCNGVMESELCRDAAPPRGTPDRSDDAATIRTHRNVDEAVLVEKEHTNRVSRLAHEPSSVGATAEENSHARQACRPPHSLPIHTESVGHGGTAPRGPVRVPSGRPPSTILEHESVPGKKKKSGPAEAHQPSCTEANPYLAKIRSVYHHGYVFRPYNVGRNRNNVCSANESSPWSVFEAPSECCTETCCGGDKESREGDDPTSHDADAVATETRNAPFTSGLPNASTPSCAPGAGTINHTCNNVPCMDTSSKAQEKKTHVVPDANREAADGMRIVRTAAAVRDLFQVEVLPESNQGVSYVRNYILQVLVPGMMIDHCIDVDGHVDEVGLFSPGEHATLHDSALRSLQLDPAVYMALEQSHAATRVTAAQPPHILYGFYWVMDDDIGAFHRSDGSGKRNSRLSTRAMLREVGQRLTRLRRQAVAAGKRGSSTSLSSSVGATRVGSWVSPGGSATGGGGAVFTCCEDALRNNPAVRTMPTMSTNHANDSHDGSRGHASYPAPLVDPASLRLGYHPSRLHSEGAHTTARGLVPSGHPSQLHAHTMHGRIASPSSVPSWSLGVHGGSQSSRHDSYFSSANTSARVLPGCRGETSRNGLHTASSSGGVSALPSSSATGDGLPSSGGHPSSPATPLSSAAAWRSTGLDSFTDYYTTACYSLEYSRFAFAYSDKALAINSYNTIACLFNYALLHSPPRVRYFPTGVTRGVRTPREVLGTEGYGGRHMMWYRFAVREDYDFTLQLIARGLHTVRFRNLSFDVPQMNKVRGGMTDYYRAGGDHMRAENERFVRQWPAVAQHWVKGKNDTERDDIRVRWDLLHPMRTRYPGAYLFLRQSLCPPVTPRPTTSALEAVSAPPRDGVRTQSQSQSQSQSSSQRGAETAARTRSTTTTRASSSLGDFFTAAGLAAAAPPPSVADQALLGAVLPYPVTPPPPTPSTPTLTGSVRCDFEKTKNKKDEEDNVPRAMLPHTERAHVDINRISSQSNHGISNNSSGSGGNPMRSTTNTGHDTGLLWGSSQKRARSPVEGAVRGYAVALNRTHAAAVFPHVGSASALHRGVSLPAAVELTASAMRGSREGHGGAVDVWKEGEGMHGRADSTSSLPRQYDTDVTRTQRRDGDGGHVAGAGYAGVLNKNGLLHRVDPTDNRDSKVIYSNGNSSNISSIRSSSSSSSSSKNNNNNNSSSSSSGSNHTGNSNHSHGADGHVRKSWKGYAVERWRDIHPSEASRLGLRRIPSHTLHVGETVAIILPLFTQQPSVVLATLIEQVKTCGMSGMTAKSGKEEAEMIQWTAVAQHVRGIPLLTVTNCYEIPHQGIEYAARLVDRFFDSIDNATTPE